MPLHVGESVVRDLGENATMLTVPGVGHWPHEEAPDVVLPAIAEFLRAP
jgi:pimeloyl-ACP methyl ester carboxylesterase